MARADRVAAIKRIEEIRNHRVITYVTGDRFPIPAQMHDDALRPIYDQLRSIGKTESLDLFIYSRGGASDVPWRIANALRMTASKNWSVLIPFRANSAATLLALGADEIVLGRNGELGPIDPSLNLQRITKSPDGGQTMMQESVSVEDIMAYVKFVQERGGLTDQAALSASMLKLADRIDAITLGSAYRTHSHIRDVARRMLSSSKAKHEPQVVDGIIETLAEKVYAHGHAITFGDALAVGLPVKQAPANLDDAMWDLLAAYEADLKLRTPIDAQAKIVGKDEYTEDVTSAAVETTAYGFEFNGQFFVKAKRQMPTTLNVTLSIVLQAPVGPAPAPSAGQGGANALEQLLQNAQAQLQQLAQDAAKAAVAQQAPVVGMDAGVRNGEWRRVEN